MKEAIKYSLPENFFNFVWLNNKVSSIAFVIIKNIYEGIHQIGCELL